MQFRCPNCQHPIQVDEDLEATRYETEPEVIECPSCHESFNLSGDAESTIAAAPGMRIAHFEIQEMLGEGSFGTVYKAWDTELQRNVAIKIPREGRITPETSRQFLREARTAAAISHPHVVSVHEIGKHEDKYYIVTQLIDGLSLREYLVDHTLETRTAVQLMIKLLRAADVFHQMDPPLVHRDLKPGNILLDDANEPHIADFGLALREHPHELTVTHTGRIVGTLLYMPPEQARGERDRITCSSDVYALGVILYEMLTGRRPFTAGSSRTLLYSILHDDPVPPRRIRRDIPRDLETICLKALQKIPAERYASAGAMADDLQRFLDGRPILAPRMNPLTPAVKWIRRNRGLTAALSLAFVAVAVALTFASRESIPENAQPVVIETTPPADRIEFLRCHPLTRKPLPESSPQIARPGRPVWLIPGQYRVLASDTQGRFHEVWRTVPESSADVPLDGLYPHQDFTRDPDDRSVILPPIRLFRTDEIADELIPIPGGTFTMGSHDNPRASDAKHEHPVASFQLGRVEVSWDRFRSVMNRITHRGGDNTYLQILTSMYGDRSHMEGTLPVTGYPIDVAILYCELAGCRLPGHAEYEFAATRRGTADYPTGAAPAIAADATWETLAVTAATQDATPEGVKNLYASVAEYTASSPLAYSQLYPRLFAASVTSGDVSALAVRDFAGGDTALSAADEVRGAPERWVRSGEQSSRRDVRQRIAIPLGPVRSADAAAVFGQIGWRVCRSESLSRNDAR